MKNLISLILIACLTGCFGTVPLKTDKEGKPMPNFSLLLLDSTTHFRTEDIGKGRPTVLFYFGTRCSYSREQAEEIIANIKSLKYINFYLLTTAPYEEMKSFNEYYRLNQYKNITIGIDYTSYFPEYFKAPGVPYIAIYDNNKKLKQVFLGTVSARDIKHVVDE